MSTDNKTLADVQPGGKVMLGDQMPPLPASSAHCPATGEPLFSVAKMKLYAQAVLSAQPSPGGQGDALELLEAYDRAVEDLSAERSDGWNEDNRRPQLEADVAELRAELVEALAASQPVGEPVAEAWIVVKQHVWDHGDDGRPTLAYLWPSEFERRVYPSFEAASAFIKEGDWPLGFVAMQIQAPPAQSVDLGARPIDTAPRDGTMVRLLVQFEENATEDTAEPAWTIGACNNDNVGEDERIGWQFAGWCWAHDHFTEGKGTPVGWLPLVGAEQAVDLGAAIKAAFPLLTDYGLHHPQCCAYKLIDERHRLHNFIDSKAVRNG